MTPKERLLARIVGQPVDRIPNLNIVMLFPPSIPAIATVIFAEIIRFW